MQPPLELQQMQLCYLTHVFILEARHLHHPFIIVARIMPA